MNYDLQRLKNPTKKSTIQKAIRHQNRVKFHVETDTTRVEKEDTGETDFFAMVKNLLPENKFELFKNVFRWPVDTNEVTGVCFEKLARIFDGRNPVYSFAFKAGELLNDYLAYRNALKINERFATEVWKFFQTEFNGLIVCDIARQQTTARPEPYFYLLSLSNVIDYDTDRDGNIKYLLFQESDAKDTNVIAIDTQSYRVYERKNNAVNPTPIVENIHKLDYCPARWLSNEPEKIGNKDIKASPIDKQLSALDWLLFFSNCKKNLDLFGAYPIISGYEQNCNYTNDATDEYCDGHGNLKNNKGSYVFDANGTIKKCPICAKRRILGPGSFVEIPIPGENQPDLSNPVSMLAVDVNALNYSVAELNRLRANIITGICGESEKITAEAINEKQVEANFESQTSVLNRLKRTFESAQEWTEKTICLLRYGDQFQTASISYGTEFYLYSAAELRERYKTAKESNAPESELDAIMRDIIETEYRNNPDQRQRMLILSDLEPYKHLSMAELLTLNEKGLVDAADLKIKINFSTLIKRFEREQANVTAFGVNIPYAEKIEKILNELKNYINGD